jgi:SAM-dependent methyltransferase
MPLPSRSSGSVEEAIVRLTTEPVNSWDSPSRFGFAGQAYRRVLRRALRPYDARRREIDQSLAQALRDVDARLADAGPARAGSMPPVWADDSRPPLQPLGPIGDLIGVGSVEEEVAAIERATMALAGFGESQARLLRKPGFAGVRERLHRDRIAIPAPEDRQGYSVDDDLAYWLSGLGDSLLLEHVAAERGRPLEAGRRVLDIGCSSGRVLRHLHTSGSGLQLFGVDIARVHVEWARQHLPAAITVAQTTVLPQLPFEDASVDVVYGLSLFTHVADFEEALLLEVRRILRPDGFALFTIHNERLWDDLCLDRDFWLRRTAVEIPHRAEPMWVEPIEDSFFSGPMPAPRVVLRNISASGLHHTNVIHSDAWLRERWGRMFELESVKKAMHGVHQDGIVLGRS